MNGRVSRLLVALVVPALVLAGCGVPEDAEPRMVGEEEAVYRFLLGEGGGTTTTTEAPPPADLGPGSVFWEVLGGEDELSRIEEVAIQVNIDAPTESALKALFSGPTETDRDDGYNTAIPETLLLVDVRQDQEGIVAVGLDSQIDGGIQALGGQRLQVILAQIVYTATASGDFDSVRFTVNDEGLPVPDQDGTASATVNRNSYSLIASPPNP
ncbi:MAG: GerMN domain-containing protein [Actinomycetia bacterium]|nr:GerMN domain-containing protein [Actinomycetes bacterium]